MKFCEMMVPTMILLNANAITSQSNIFISGFFFFQIRKPRIAMINANNSGSTEKRYSAILAEVSVPMLSTRNVGKRDANMKNASSSGKNGMFLK